MMNLHGNVCRVNSSLFLRRRENRRERKSRMWNTLFRTYSFNFVSTRLVETGFKKTRTRTRGIKTKLRTKEMRRENFQFSSSLDETAPSHLFLFYQFHYGRLLFMEATSVPCIRIIPIPSGNLLQQRHEKRRRDWKRKRRRKEKGNGTFRSSRDHVFHTLSSHDLSASLSSPFFLFFSILFFIFERKIDGLITVLRSVRGEGEDVSTREATGSTCSSLLRHCYSTEVAQNTRFPLFVTVSRAYGFALRPRLLSICRVEKCLDRVSISKNFGWLTWQPSNEQPLNVKESWRFVRSIVFRIRLSEIHQRFE